MASRKAHSSNNICGGNTGINSPISEHGGNGTAPGARRHSSTIAGSPNSSHSISFNSTLGVGANGNTNSSGNAGNGALPAALEDRMRQYIPATITRVLDYARASTPNTSGSGAGIAGRRLSFNNDSSHHRNSYTGGGGGADLDDALANETRRLVVVFLNLGLSEDEVRAAQYSHEGAERMHAMMATVQRCCYRYQVRDRYSSCFILFASAVHLTSFCIPLYAECYNSFL